MSCSQRATSSEAVLRRGLGPTSRMPAPHAVDAEWSGGAVGTLGLLDRLHHLGLGFKYRLRDRQDISRVGRGQVRCHQDQGHRARHETGVLAGQERQEESQSEDDRRLAQAADDGSIARDDVERTEGRKDLRTAKRREDRFPAGEPPPRARAGSAPGARRRPPRSRAPRPAARRSQPSPASADAASAVSVKSFAGITELAKARQDGRHPPVNAAVRVAKVAVTANGVEIDRVERADVGQPVANRRRARRGGQGHESSRSGWCTGPGFPAGPANRSRSARPARRAPAGSPASSPPAPGSVPQVMRGHPRRGPSARSLDQVAPVVIRLKRRAEDIGPGQLDQPDRRHAELVNLVRAPDGNGRSAG